MDKQNTNIEYAPVKVPADKKLFVTVMILVIIGFMAVFSASLPMCMSKHINPLYYIIQHLFWAILGGFGLVLFSLFDYRKLKKITFKFAIFVIVLLLLVKFTPLGVTINGARRWLNLGLFQFQPSEFTKLAIIMLLAHFFSLDKKNMFRKIPKFALTFCVMIFIVLKQPNLSMTLILLGISFFMYFCSGKTLKPVVAGMCILVCLVGMIKFNIIDLSNFIEPFQMSRIMNWNNSGADLQGEGYQVFHSKIAISSGGIFGQGYGASKEKLGWLPECHTDFIFSVVAEEMGFWGCLIIIMLFLHLFYRGTRIASKSPTLYGRLLAFGITISVTMQAFFNISVATSFLPATGITLPFISYGGSSLFVTMCMMGILLNISKTQLRRVVSST